MKSKLLTLCLSLVLSVGIWLYVITVVSPESQETFEGVPVQMQSLAVLEDRGLVVTDIDYTSVSLQLGGSRTDLLQLNSSNIRVYADVSTIYEPGVHYIGYTVSFPGSIPNGAIEIQSRSPDTIRVTVEKKASKRLDVTIDYKGAVPNGYITDEANIQLSTKSVIISGPQTLLESVQTARITIDLTNRTETVSGVYPYVLLDREGNVVSDEQITSDVFSIHVNLQIRKLKQVPVKYHVNYGGGATIYNTTVVANLDSIEISGHKNLIEDISVIDVGIINLWEYPDSRTVTLPIALPSGVRNESGTPEISITITFTGLVTKTLSCSNIVPVNLPEGMSAKFVERRLTVTIRGTQEEVNAVSADDITITVDLSTMREGHSTMPAEIVINSDIASNVGAVGTYTLTANMFPVA